MVYIRRQTKKLKVGEWINFESGKKAHWFAFVLAIVTTEYYTTCT